MLSRVLAACGGFLLAVIWMDLMFDVQVAGSAETDAAVAAIAAYYRRVTTEAFPMNRLIGAVMLVAIGGSLYDAYRARTLRATVAAALAVTPITLAAVRTFPNAVRLGSGTDPNAVTHALATAILRDHLWCFAAIALFTALQLGAQRRTST